MNGLLVHGAYTGAGGCVRAVDCSDCSDCSGRSGLAGLGVVAMAGGERVDQEDGEDQGPRTKDQGPGDVHYAYTRSQNTVRTVYGQGPAPGVGQSPGLAQENVSVHDAYTNCGIDVRAVNDIQTEDRARAQGRPREGALTQGGERVHCAYTARTVIHSLLYTNRLCPPGWHARTKSFPDLERCRLEGPPS